MADLSIMYQPIAGGWVKLGTQTGGGRGVFAESITMEGDRGEGGCHAAQFKLKQDPRWINSEMQAFTPIAVWDGGECIWSGRTIMTPTTFGEDDVEVVVMCQGWWQHLKDDCTDREWVVDDLSRWKDCRQTPTEGLSNFVSRAHVQVDGAAVLALPYVDAGGNWPANTFVGITIDLGANNLAKRLVMAWDSTNNASGITCYARGHDQPAVIGAAVYDDAFSFAMNSGASGTTAGTFAAGHRYVSIFLFFAAGGTLGAEVRLRASSLKVFTDTADESGNASILKASTVISETLDAVAPKISPRRDLITTTALNLPQFPGSPAWRYGDELIKQANAPHGYITRLTPDPVPVFEYFPVPTDYRFVVGEGDYTLLEPAAQDGQQVYSRVISEFEDAAGVRGYTKSVDLEPVLAPNQVANPSFDTNASNWTVDFGALTRSTAQFNSSPASGRLTVSGDPPYVRSDAVTVTPGKRYRVTARFRKTAASTIGGFEFLNATTGAILPHYEDFTTKAQMIAAYSAGGTGAWFTLTAEFIAPSTGSIRVGVYDSSGTADVHFDDVVIYSFGRSAVERRGFQRTALRPMTSRSTTATAQAISDLELAASSYPPFKGTISVVGRIPLKGGGSIDASHVPGMVGENLLIADLYDPNTQRLGRIGNVQSAVYDHKTRRATIGIDRDLFFISTLRDRLALASR